MKKSALLIPVFLLSLLIGNLYAVPLSDEVIEKLQNEGRLDEIPGALRVGGRILFHEHFPGWQSGRQDPTGSHITGRCVHDGTGR